MTRCCECERNTKYGGTLLEVIMGLIIFSATASILLGTITASVRMLSVHERASASHIADSSMQWMVDRLRSADRVSILASNRVVLTFQTIPVQTEVIALSNGQIVLLRDGTTEAVAEPVRALDFSDPSGRGLACRIQLIAGDPSGIVAEKRLDQTVAIDWLKQ